MADASSFTHVQHAAADSTIGPTLSPLKRYDQIVDGTRNILDLGVATAAARGVV
jgi:UDP-glucuronate decarboxylase